MTEHLLPQKVHLSHGQQLRSVIATVEEAEEGEVQVQCLSGLQSEFSTSLGNIMNAVFKIPSRKRVVNLSHSEVLA